MTFKEKLKRLLRGRKPKNIVEWIEYYEYKFKDIVDYNVFISFLFMIMIIVGRFVYGLDKIAIMFLSVLFMFLLGFMGFINSFANAYNMRKLLRQIRKTIEENRGKYSNPYISCEAKCFIICDPYNPNERVNCFNNCMEDCIKNRFGW